MRFIKISMCVLSLFFNSNVLAIITQTTDLNEIKKSIYKLKSKDALIVFDVDLVLITPSDQAFKNRNKDGRRFVRAKMDQWKNNNTEQETIELLSVLESNVKVEPLTSSTVQYIHLTKLKVKGIKQLQ